MRRADDARAFDDKGGHDEGPAVDRLLRRLERKMPRRVRHRLSVAFGVVVVDQPMGLGSQLRYDQMRPLNDADRRA
jgi:hypothetical protein